MAEQPREGMGDEELGGEEELTDADEIIQQCVEDSNECQLVCTETITYCLQVGGPHAELAHLRTLMDCADACQLSTTLLLRRSEFAPRAAELTAMVCDRCAASCDRFPDDQWMVECADTCRRCADSCREVAGLYGEETP